MKYLMLVCVDRADGTTGDPGRPAGPAPAEIDVDTWVEEMDGSGVRLIGERIRPDSDATTVRVRDGEVLLTDGPYAETKERMAGFDIIECADLDEAIEVAAKHPMSPRRGDRVRPFWTRLSAADDAVAAAYADEWGRIVATLIRLTGDWDLAEECAQDAFAAGARSAGRPTAYPTGPGPGSPPPRATARSTGCAGRAVEAEKLREVARDGPNAWARPAHGDFPDERLELMFTCCHPALTREAQVALTLRTLAGLRTAEIARAFLVSRAHDGAAAVPGEGQDPPRRDPVPGAAGAPAARAAARPCSRCCTCCSTRGTRRRPAPTWCAPDLSGEAIRLARVLAALMPDEPEAQGLLALMLLHDARRAAGSTTAGDLVPLEEQDRSTWDRARDRRRRSRCSSAALRRGRPGVYQVQAAIAACHADGAATPPTPTGRRSPRCTAELARLVARAGRRAEPRRRGRDGRRAGRRPARWWTTWPAGGALAGYYLLPATRADLLRRLGRRDEAAAAYREALALVTTEAERRFLTRRLGEVSDE